MVRTIMWSLKEICEMISDMQKNKYDCIIMIDGKRGIGKSTLGSKLMYRLGFSPKRDIVYSREDVIKSYAKKNKGYIFADEMVNVGYLRDFWGSDQKTLIKVMNMVSLLLIGLILPYDKKVIQILGKSGVEVAQKGHDTLFVVSIVVCIVGLVWAVWQSKRETPDMQG